MLASLPGRSDSSGSNEQQTAVVVTPINGNSKKRIYLEYAQPVLEAGGGSEPHRREILQVPVSVQGSEQNSGRSLEALCNAADSELKNIGHQVAIVKEQVKNKNATCLSQVPRVVNSVMGTSSRLLLPAVRLEPGISHSSQSDAVLLMQKPFVVSSISHPSTIHVPVQFSTVITGSSVSTFPTACSSAVVASKVSSEIVHATSKSSLQDASLSLKLNSRHTCGFCGRVCAKPSVLQKHIRIHTGERPYPCTMCGLHFKTKSNLYKHRKSRTHLCTLSGCESMSVDESAAAANVTCVAEDELQETTECPVVAGDPDIQEPLQQNTQSVTQLQLSPTLSDSKVLSPDSAGTACKLFTVIDGSMYMMEQVALPAWQTVVRQVQQDTTASVSLSSPVLVSDDSNFLAEQLANSRRMSVGGLAMIESVHFPQLVESSSAQSSDRSGASKEALQDHITRLISENASIINMPMAEAPRAKRVLRQSSDVTMSSGTKLSASRPLLRTRSLTPCPTVVSAPSHSDTIDNDTRTIFLASATEDSRSDLPSQTLPEASNRFLPIARSPSAGRQYLTVPKEPYCIDDVCSGVQLAPCRDIQPVDATDIECSGVRIVLELADSSRNASPVDSASAYHESIVPHLPILSTDMTAQPVSVGIRPSVGIHSPECQSATVVPVSSLIPTLCMIKPADQGLTSAVCVQTNPPVHSVPLQYVLLGNSEVTPSATSKALVQAVTTKPLVVEVVSPQQPPRRGRPKGSKNRPKLAASSSEPKGSVTPRTVTVSELLSASVMSSASTPDMLWRLKLKDQLLRRSLSTDRSGEQRASPAVQEQQVVSSCSKSTQSYHIPVSYANSLTSSSSMEQGGPLMSTSSLGSPSIVVATSAVPPIVRSRSCDASVPPKKRRKTLTELGRGTVFGTRVEESSTSVSDSHSNKLGDDSVFLSSTETESVVSSAISYTTTLSPVCAHTNRALQIMYNSPPLASTLRSSTVLHSGETMLDAGKQQAILIRLPTVIGSKIPGLVRHSGAVTEAEPHVTSSDRFTSQQLSGSLVCSEDNLLYKKFSSSCHSTFSAQVSVHSCSSHMSTDPSPCVSEGHNLAGSTVSPTDETELFELPSNMSASSSGTLLLLGHCYPSLGIVAEPTFCSILSTQPTCMEACSTADRRSSTYDSWHTNSSAKETKDEPILTARETFSLYRTARLGKDLSYAAAPAVDSRSGGILTHSSYWKYRTDCCNSSSAEDQVVSTSYASTTMTVVNSGEDALDALIAASGNSSCSVEIIGMSSDVAEAHTSLSQQNAASKLAQSSQLKVEFSQSAEETSQKRVLIFPGGYRSTESYTYVRGRGRGRYVCGRCGVRCKKPSVLRKHLRSHTDVRPHHCDVCDVGFKTKGNLSKHLNSKAHHARSSGSSSEHADCGKSMEGSSCDADIDSSCELLRGSSALDPESDSGCELQAGSSYEVDAESTLALAQGASVECEAEECNKVEKLASGFAADETRVQIDSGCASSNVHVQVAYCQNLSSDSSAYQQQIVIGTPVHQEESLQNPVTVVDNRRHPLTRISAVESRAASDGVTVAVTRPPTLNTLPFVIVGGRQLIQLSSPTVPVADGQQPASSKPSVGITTVAPHRASSATISLPPPSRGNMSPVLSGAKPHQKLSRLNAIDLTVASLADSGIALSPTAAVSGAVNLSSFRSASQSTISAPPPGAAEMDDACDVERAMLLRREIVPIPGAVCSTEEAARVGSCYVCFVCAKTFSSAPQLAVHRKIHYFERQFRCADCRSSFASRASLEQHRITEHHVEVETTSARTDPRPYKCDGCGVAFRIAGHLAKHKRAKVHTTRLESSQDALLAADTEQPLDVSAASVRDAGTAAEQDGCQTDDICCQEMPASARAGVSVDEQRSSGCGSPTDVRHGAARDLRHADAVDVVDSVINRVHPVVTVTDSVVCVHDPSVGEACLPDLVANPSVAVTLPLVMVDESLLSQVVGVPDPVASVAHSMVTAADPMVSSTSPVPVSSVSDAVSLSGSSATETDVSSDLQKCPLCGQLLADLKALMTHLTSHAERRPYVCEHCDAGFSTQPSLAEHIKLHVQTCMSCSRGTKHS